MTENHRRGVTRGYVWGLVFAVAVVAFAILLAAWGGLTLLTGVGPVSTPGISLATAALIVLLCLIFLAWVMWNQSLLLLRGRRSPSWGHIVLAALGGYLLWGLGGTLFGLSIDDTWVSPFAGSLALAWAIGGLLQWAVLARRVYTDRETPQWPWERRGEPGPDWTIIGDHPWRNPDEDGTDEYDPGDGREDPEGPEGRR